MNSVWTFATSATKSEEDFINFEATVHLVFLTGLSDFGSKWVRLAPNGTNLGLLQIRFQNIFFKMSWNLIWKCSEIWSEKVPDLSHLGPIWPTLCPNLVTQGWTISTVCRRCRTNTRWRKRRVPHLIDTGAGSIPRSSCSVLCQGCYVCHRIESD